MQDLVDVQVQHALDDVRGRLEDGDVVEARVFRQEDRQAMNVRRDYIDLQRCPQGRVLTIKEEAMVDHFTQGAAVAELEDQAQLRQG